MVTLQWVAGASLLCMVAVGSAVAQSNDAQGSMVLAGEAARRGDLESAISAWSRAEAAFLRARDPGGRVEALLRRAEAYARSGFVPEAIADLGLCRQIAHAEGLVGREAEIDGALGSALIHHDREVAEDLLRRSLDSAVEQERWSVAASAANNLGNLLALER